MKRLILSICCINIAITTFSQIPNYVPTDSLVGWWPFNGNANDQSVNLNNATINGTILTSDRFGNTNSAYNFNGVNNYLSVNNNPTIQFSSSQQTLSFWIKITSIPNPVNEHALFERMDQHLTTDPTGSSAKGFKLAFAGSSIFYAIKNGNSSNWGICTIPNNLLNLNTYQHVVFTNDGNTIQSFLNGVLVNQSSIPLGTSIGLNSNNLLFGKETWISNGANMEYYNGDLDDVGIWNRALSFCEINQLYNSQVNLLNLDAGNDQTICAGTSIILSASGANSYVWSNGVANGVSFIPTSTNTYTVTGTNSINGCTNTDQLLVTVNDLPIVDAGYDQILCEGTQVSLIGSGANIYSWNNNVINGVSFTPSVSSEYILTGIDSNGCENKDTVSIIINNNSSSMINETGIDSFTLNGQTYYQSGVYSQIIPNYLGCDSIITLDLSLNFTGIEENTFLTLNSVLYPNPAMDYINLEGLSDSNFIIENILGQACLKGHLSVGKQTINISQLPSGIYLMRSGESDVNYFRKQ